MAIALGLMLGLASTARAQGSMNAFGGYPAGITTGSQSGFYPGGYLGPYSTTAPYVPPTTRYGPSYSRYYSSGFYGGIPGTVTYGNGVDLSARSAYPYGTPGYNSSYGGSPMYYQGPAVRGWYGGRPYR
jgi:hypothetical protein